MLPWPGLLLAWPSTEQPSPKGGALAGEAPRGCTTPPPAVPLARREQLEKGGAAVLSGDQRECEVAECS